MSVPMFRLKRTVGGTTTVILTWTPPSPGLTSTPAGSTTFTPAGAAIRSLLDNPGGAATYRLEYLPNTPFPAAGKVTYRSVLVQGVRR